MFASKDQQRFMFSQHPKMAMEFAKKTDFSSLPEHAKKKAIQQAAKRSK